MNDRPLHQTTITIELEREDDGRWSADIKGRPNTTILVYGTTRLDAVRNALEALEWAEGQ